MLAGAARAPEGLRPIPDLAGLAAIAGDISLRAPAIFDRDEVPEFAVSRRDAGGRSANELGGLVCLRLIGLVGVWCEVYDWLYSDGES